MSLGLLIKKELRDISVPSPSRLRAIVDSPTPREASREKEFSRQFCEPLSVPNFVAGDNGGMRQIREWQTPRDYLGGVITRPHTVDAPWFRDCDIVCHLLEAGAPWELLYFTAPRVSTSTAGIAIDCLVGSSRASGYCRRHRDRWCHQNVAGCQTVVTCWHRVTGANAGARYAFANRRFCPREWFLNDVASEVKSLVTIKGDRILALLDITELLFFFFRGIPYIESQRLIRCKFMWILNCWEISKLFRIPISLQLFGEVLERISVYCLIFTLLTRISFKQKEMLFSVGLELGSLIIIFL